MLGGYIFFNRQSSFLWVHTVFLFSSTSTFIRLRQISYSGFSRNEKKLGRFFIFTFHYIGHVLLLIKFGDFVDHIYPIKVEIKDTQILFIYSSYIDPHLEVRTSEEGNYNKRDDFNVLIVNFAFICSNIPAAPVYM